MAYKSPPGPTPPLPPYRVEWRHDLTTIFHAPQGAETHDEAREKAAEMRKAYQGQTRIISQHVIEVEGP